MEEVEVPSYFVCPITLDVMRDPVTLPTGITYDRHAIHRWLRLAASCPLTKLPVAPDCEPTPNHTLCRLIRSWCALHRPDDAVDHTMKSAPADCARLAALVSRLADAKNKRPSQEALAALRELRDVVAEGERGRELVAAVPGSADALLDVFVSSATSAPENSAAALDVISSLRLPERCLARAVDRDGAALVGALVSTLQGHSGPDADAASRARAAVLLADVMACMSPSRAASLPEQAFVEAVRLLRGDDGMGASTSMATKAALRVLAGATAHGRNRVKAAEAGAVAALVDMLLLVNGERRRAWCELALCALNRLCGCAEGRAALVAHGAGVAAVGAWVAGASMAASAKAVRVLRSIARHTATVAVVQEMAATGAVGKLCLVAASVPEEEWQWCDERTRERARETLRLHARAWRSSPCLHPTLQALYPC
ncbi:E3 ubiquitin-protein ligase PUB23-like [Triticum dicoccoides]|uniref:E3 ubiquitin-protein ligase PUB23-like n=1 Tax=Triticum dicoccoides TaxID=85692 RepID=UPI00162C1B30|nr:E3 ubiquitin-protein ligase PUB23-like [Triticum dicoccoides]